MGKEMETAGYLVAGSGLLDNANATPPASAPVEQASDVQPAVTPETGSATTATQPIITDSITTARNRDRERSRDNARPRNAQELKPKDIYYRPEYGWIMSDADVAAEKEVKGRYQTAAEDMTKQTAANEQEYQAALATGKSGINSAYDSAIAAAKNPKTDMVGVQALDGWRPVASYQLPRSVALNLSQGSLSEANSGRHFASSWGEGPNTAPISGRDQFTAGIGRTTGSVLQVQNRAGLPGGAQYLQALLDGLSGAEGQVENAAQTYSASIANANTQRAAELLRFETDSNAIYATNKATWDAQLEELRTGYGTRVATGKEQYEKKKKEYNDSITGMAGLLG